MVTREFPLREAPSLSPLERVELLIDLAEFAVHRLQNDPQKDHAWNLAARVDEWERQVLAALDAAGASESDKSWFRVLGTYNSKSLPAPTPGLAKIRNEVSEKIDRFRDIAPRLEDEALYHRSSRTRH